MQIHGDWLRRAGLPVLPLIEIYVRRADGSFTLDLFLIDSGADRTIFSGSLFQSLGISAMGSASGSTLFGIGGQFQPVDVATELEFRKTAAVPHRIAGQFAAATDPNAIDISILGRDVLDQFDVILSNRRDEILLLNDPHGYTIHS